MSRNKAVITLLILIFFSGNFLFAQKKDSSVEPLTIIAHYKEKIKEIVIARGDIEIHYKNIILYADNAEINTETKDVYAEGNVVIQFPEEVVSAEEIHINLDSSQGELKKGFGMIQPTVFYEAEDIERKDASVYSFRKAKITSCTQPVARWKFSCSKANFRKNDYIEMWGAVFSIKKIPIFYFPYLRYPIGKERATGFLMPQVGFSGQKGMSYTQSFYWAMARNMGATLSLDYYTARGLGGGLEYQYIFSGGTNGQLNLYHFNFKESTDEEPSPNAYAFRLTHGQALPFNFSLVADIDYNSSFDFLREFNNDFKRAIVSNRRSQVYLSRAWSYFNFNARVSRFETFNRESDSSVINKSFPAVSFSSSKIRLFSPLYFSFSSSFSRWEYGSDSAYEAGNQKRSQSLAFSPNLTLPFKSIPWLILNSSFLANIDYHFKSINPDTGMVEDVPLLAYNYGLNFRLIGPVFYKIFYGADGEANLKHIIEPTFSYRYDSPMDEYDLNRIISYRAYLRYHEISYGLTNRFLIKQNNMPREILTLGLRQIFYLVREESPLRSFLVNGEIPQFSDINCYLRFYPARKYSVDFSARFNPYYMAFSTLRLGANFGSPDDSVFLRMNWYKSTNPYIESVLGNRHQINCFGGLKIPKLSLEALAEIDFNVHEGKMLYSAFAFVYNYQCLDFTVELKTFYFREKPETQFLFSFGLGNIGKTTGFFSGLGF